MLVVADTSPLNYLALMDLIDLLPRLYGQIAVPEAVIRELQHDQAPEAVRAWAAKPPDWLQIHAADVNAADLIDLDLGEAEAIALARRLSADLVLMDDQAGRRAVLQAGLRVAGTLAVLDDASSRGMLDLPDALARLSNTSFRASRTLLDSLKRRRR